MPCEKDAYISQAEAEERLVAVKASRKAQGHGGKSWKRLVAYRCWKCRMWHLGRDNSERLQKLHEIGNTQPVKRIPSTGDLKRRLKKQTAIIDGGLKHRAYLLGQLIQAQAADEAARQQAQYEAALAAINYVDKKS
jgi:hypothetical protein